ncbi:ATP-binding protein [Nonomuraea sp. NPDC050556]|uniref:HAMP domain-containing sensor histidine kinase n=1 Tax=Nonomuraea sp. NPDC050556 TaxID=3364369 RepID=UPI00379E0012
MGLRRRMAASYVLVTTAAVLVVEAVLLGIYVPSVVSDSGLQNRLQNLANQDAKILSLTLSRLNADFPKLDMSSLLNLAQKAAGQRISLDGTTTGGDDTVRIEYTKGAAPDRPIEVLTDAAGQVVTSSAMGTYAHGDTLDVPATAGGGKAKTRTGNTTWWLSPVLLAPAGAAIDANAQYKVAGYVYVQAPSGYLTPGATAESLLPLLAPGALVLVLVIPVGLIFGLLSTRRLIGRVRRLAEVTGTVAQGDFRPRVPVTATDEVGRLEESFNRMTERLEAALDAERTAGQSEARQAERARIARELHDSISQDLFSLSLLAAGMRRAAPERLRREAESMERTSTRAMREMQALLLELRPVALEDAGLIPAIEELCRAYESRLGLTVDAVLEEVSLPPPTEHAVLRLVQEALGNAIKHADPALVEVRLSRVAPAVQVEIRDDGTGFDPAAAAAGHGMGLRLMRERVEELGGTFLIRTEPGKGTTVTARFGEAS